MTNAIVTTFAYSELKAIGDLIDTCSAPDTIEGVEAFERFAANPVTFATLATAKDVRDDAHAALASIEVQRKTAKAPFLAGGKAVDAVAVEVLERLGAVKAKLSTAIARVEAQAEADRKAALLQATEAAQRGEVDVAAIAEVNALASVDSKWRWQYECVDIKRLYAEAPEYCKLEPDGLRLQQLALSTPKDREPPAVPGVVWNKVPYSRAKGVR